MKSFRTVLFVLAGFILMGGAWALPTTYTTTPPPPATGAAAAAEDDTDIGLQIVEDYIYQPSLRDGNQIGDSVVAAGKKYYRLVGDSLETAQYMDDRIQPYDVRAEFNYRKYWHSIHVLDQKTLDTLAGAWAVGDAVDIFWAYGFRVVRYSQASLVLDDKGQVLSIMVRVRQPGELQRYPIFLSMPYLTWFLETRPPDDTIIPDLLFLSLLEASTVESYTLRNAMVADTGRYTGRYTRLAADEADYYPAIFYVEYVDTRYICHPIFYDVYYDYGYPWWAYDHRAYLAYYNFYGVWPRYHPRYHGYYNHPRPIPWMVSGKGPLYDKHYRRAERADTISAGRTREVTVVDAYKTPRGRTLPEIGRGDGKGPRAIADVKSRVRDGRDNLAPNPRSSGGPAVQPDRRTAAPIDVRGDNRSREGGAIEWRPVKDRIPNASDRRADRNRDETPVIQPPARSRPIVDDVRETPDRGGIQIIGSKREGGRGGNVQVIGRGSREAPGADNPPVVDAPPRRGNSPSVDSDRPRTRIELPDKRSGRGVEVDTVPARDSQPRVQESPGERGRSRSIDVVAPPERKNDSPRVNETPKRDTAPRVDNAPKVDSVPRGTPPSAPPAERKRESDTNNDNNNRRVITPEPDRGRDSDPGSRKNIDVIPSDRGRDSAPPGKRGAVDSVPYSPRSYQASTFGRPSVDSARSYSAPAYSSPRPSLRSDRSSSAPAYSNSRPTLEARRSYSTPADTLARPTLMDRSQAVPPMERGGPPQTIPMGRGR